MSSPAEPSAAVGDAAAAALMDAIYRRQRHIYDLTRKYYLLGRDDLINALAPPPGGTILEIGCGTGRNLIAAARTYPRTRLYGLDISAEMLRTAEASLRRAGLGGRFRLARGDAADFSAATLFAVTRFDRVFFSYSLSMIPEWWAALEAGLARVAPGGRLHVVDFGQQQALPTIVRRLLRAWLRRFHVEPRAEHDTRLRALAEAAGAAYVARPLYRGYAWSGVVSVPGMDAEPQPNL